jgi:hypothetical protein
MVPYVRLSFAKHFKDGIKYLGVIGKTGRLPEISKDSEEK